MKMIPMWGNICTGCLGIIFFSQVSVTATTSCFLDVTNSVKGAVLHLIDQTFIVDILIFFASGPGLRLMSPESSRIIDNLSE